MTAFNPIYYARVYRPRSVDATETTVLTPRAGSAHGDRFRVSTSQALPRIVVARKSSSNGAAPPATARLQGLGYSVTESLAATVNDCRAYDLVVIDCSAWNPGEHNAFIRSLIQDGQDVVIAGNDISNTLYFVTTTHATSTHAPNKVSAAVQGAYQHPVWVGVTTMPDDTDSGNHVTVLNSAFATPFGGYANDGAAFSVIEFWDTGYRGRGLFIPNFSLAGSDSNRFFQNAVQYMGGYQAYLDGFPRGRSSQIDPLSLAMDSGEYTFTIGDKQLADKVTRWVTAFIGDEFGGNNLLGLRLELDESLDGGLTKSRLVTGRITRVSANGRTHIDLAVREAIDQLDEEVFVGTPHAAVNGYARRAQLMPLGLMHPYGNFPLVQPIRGKITGVSAVGSKQFIITVDRSQANPTRTLLTKSFVALQRYGVASPTSNSFGRAKVWVSPAGAGTFSAFDFSSAGNDFTTSVTHVFARPYDTNGDGVGDSPAQPALNSDVDFYIESLVSKISKDEPLLVNDVNTITLIKHLCAGYYGKIDSAGNVTWSIPIVAADFTALEADPSIMMTRFRATGTMTLREAVEKFLHPHRISLRQTESGEIGLVDMRRSSVVTVVATLTNADLIESEDAIGEWNQDRDDAVSGVEFKLYGESLVEEKDLPDAFTAPIVQPGSKGFLGFGSSPRIIEDVSGGIDVPVCLIVDA
jgi:hypothetical protein